MSRWLDLARSTLSPRADSAVSAESPRSDLQEPPIGAIGTNGRGECEEQRVDRGDSPKELEAGEQDHREAEALDADDANEQPAPEPDNLYDLVWRCSDLGIRLEAVDGALMVSGPEAAIEPLDRLLWDNRDVLVRTLSPYREGDPLEDPRSVLLVRATTRGEFN